MIADNCYWLNYNALKRLQQILVFGTSSPSLPLSTSFFVLPDIFVVSGDSNSSL